LAKQLLPADLSGSLEDTITALTAEGTTAGTLPYMSPEQLRAEAVDARTDIFSFGVVLYEMLAGAHPFRRETPMDTASAILNEEPKPLPGGHELLQHLLRRMLAKERRERYTAVHDARAVIHDLLERQATASAPPKGAREVPPEAVLPSPRNRRRVAAYILATAVAAASITVALMVALRPGPSTPTIPGIRSVIPLEPGWRLSGGYFVWERFSSLGRPSRHAFALSPDGSYLVYSAISEDRAQLFMRRMDEATARPIPGTEGGSCPFISPDGRWIGFWAEGKLKKVSADMGAATLICEAGLDGLYPIFGASWGARGHIVYATLNSGLWCVSSDGGVPERLTTLDSSKLEYSHRLPHFLPDGNAVLFTVTFHPFSIEGSHIEMLPLGGGERRLLIQDGADGRYVSSGHLVFVRQGVLMAAPFDPKRLELTGAPVAILPDVMQSTFAASAVGNSCAGQFSFSNSGIMVFAPGGVTPLPKRDLVWVDRNGAEQPLLDCDGGCFNPRLSADGRLLTYRDYRPVRSVWVYDLLRQNPRRLTFEGIADAVIMTPDSKQVTFDWSAPGAAPDRIYQILLDGSAPMVPILPNGLEGRPSSWSSDMKYLAFESQDDIYILHVTAGKAEAFVASRFVEWYAEFSPDGRWLAYTSDESSRHEVYVRPFPGPGGVYKVSSQGAVEPMWNPNGRELIYRQLIRESAEKHQLMAVRIETDPAFRSFDPVLLFDDSEYLWTRPRGYDITRDGKRFVMVKYANEPWQAVTQITLIQDWFDELKRLVPSGK